MKYQINPHCRDRYIERVRSSASSKNLYREILENLWDAKNITSQISNDCPRFILYVKERYGNNINILEKGEVIYILEKQKLTVDTYNVLTCYIKHRFLEQFKHSALSREEIFHRLKMLKNK